MVKGVTVAGILDSPTVKRWGTGATSSVKIGTLHSFPTIKKLSPTEMQSRRKKGLCYNYDEVYTLGHMCKKKQLYMLVGEDDGSRRIFQLWKIWQKIQRKMCKKVICQSP